MVIHYIYDPLCGWCYAAAPLVRAARAVLPVAAHGGGMLAGPNRRAMSPQFREHVMPHDRRIAELSGQPFGTAYTDGLLRDPGAMLDSEPPTAAVLAADRMAGRGHELLARLQTAHYVEGLRIADTGVLVQQAAAIGLDPVAFAMHFEQLQGAPVQDHFAQSRALMAQVRGQGFPTFALEHGGRFERLDSASYLGRVEAWTARLQQAVEGAVPIA
ncbi:MAG: DsbA family protein [Variovorax sp.]